MTDSGVGRQPDKLPANRAPRWLRDPLVIFLLLGVGVFTFDRWREPGDTERYIIEVTETQVNGIRARWAAQFGRTPTDQELRTLLDEAIKEEILYREAQRLALDRDDAIVRRRLAQKMTFILEDTTKVEAPRQDAVKAYFAVHTERYREPTRTTFAHVFLSGDRTTDPASDSITLLRTLRADTNDDWRTLGDPFMLLREYAGRTDREITELFGGQFAAAMATLGVGEWEGPVDSAYGTHLVRVISRTESTMPALDQVRHQVTKDLLEARRREQNQAAFEAVRERYEVRKPGEW